MFFTEILMVWFFKVTIRFTSYLILFMCVISGETCSGKSTLINKLLGKSVFIGKNLESTSTICKIRNSDRIKVTTCSSEKKTKTIDLTNRCDLNTKEGLQILKTHLTELIDISPLGKCSQFQFVDVGFPIPLLKVIFSYSHIF